MSTRSKQNLVARAFICFVRANRPILEDRGFTKEDTDEVIQLLESLSVPKTKEGKHKCKGMTKKGAQCKKFVKEGDDFCFIHCKGSSSETKVGKDIEPIEVYDTPEASNEMTVV